MLMMKPNRVSGPSGTIGFDGVTRVLLGDAARGGYQLLDHSRGRPCPVGGYLSVPWAVLHGTDERRTQRVVSTHQVIRVSRLLVNRILTRKPADAQTSAVLGVYLSKDRVTEQIRHRGGREGYGRQTTRSSPK
jgi:hypothetical protein